MLLEPYVVNPYRGVTLPRMSLGSRICKNDEWASIPCRGM